MNMIYFQDHVKHLRFYGHELYEYHHKEVEKRFNEALEALGTPLDSDYIAFVTLRFKGKSDWVVCNNALHSYERSVARWFSESNPPPISFVTSIESSQARLKDHAHIILRLSGSGHEYHDCELEALLRYEALRLEEINHRNTDSVKVRMFPFCGNSYQLGNHLEYICKTSSRHYNPLARKALYTHPRNLLKTQL